MLVSFNSAVPGLSFEITWALRFVDVNLTLRTSEMLTFMLKSEPSCDKTLFLITIYKERGLNHFLDIEIMYFAYLEEN